MAGIGVAFWNKQDDKTIKTDAIRTNLAKITIFGFTERLPRKLNPAVITKVRRTSICEYCHYITVRLVSGKLGDARSNKASFCNPTNHGCHSRRPFPNILPSRPALTSFDHRGVWRGKRSCRTKTERRNCFTFR